MFNTNSVGDPQPSIKRKACRLVSHSPELSHDHGRPLADSGGRPRPDSPGRPGSAASRADWPSGICGSRTCLVENIPDPGLTTFLPWNTRTDSLGGAYTACRQVLWKASRRTEARRTDPMSGRHAFNDLLKGFTPARRARVDARKTELRAAWMTTLRPVDRAAPYRRCRDRRGPASKDVDRDLRNRLARCTGKGRPTSSPDVPRFRR